MSQIGKIAIPDGKGPMRFIYIRDIMYCKSDRNYCIVHIYQDKPVVVARSLTKICEKLPKHLFFRILHCHAIMEDGVELIVAKRKKTKFLNTKKNNTRSSAGYKYRIQRI